SVYGEIEVVWRIENGTFSLDCKVPVGTTAKIKLPFGDHSTITAKPGRHTFKREI
ncbi:MAG: hypothetical protein IKB90_03635, partial [Alistipes sp.]|nr:hypothetical protein [Alistipes sp.]